MLARAFFDRPVLEVAPDLLGAVITSHTQAGMVSVRLTEVEAYDGSGHDPGSHAFRGRTKRNAVMFGPPGHCYVYFSYGMHWCVNLVCREEGWASAVLLRGGEVVVGEELARARRPAARVARDLARGPARLASALGLDGTWNGLDVVTPGSPLLIRRGQVPTSGVCQGPRVGVGGDGAERPWRFWLEAEPTVSPYRAHAPRHRRPAPGTVAGPDRGRAG
ncbi:MAG TPA: DNA-3-methyladenine glycosylase [Actinomycetes bacterium]|nr:DNA-3-methyladenine glycosylase [Actinomycetes bacterium]